jgi:hypothetical protein
MRKIIALLDGGLGNKFNGLYSAIHLSKLYNKTLHINNVRNNMGDFDLKKLFNIPYEYTEYTHTQFDKAIPIFLHKNYFKYNRNTHNISTINPSIEEFIFLTDRIIMNDIGLRNVINDLSINENIKNVVSEFLVKNNINKNTIGIHIRGSDSSCRLQNINDSFDLINKNRNKMIFACTDEREIFDKFKQYNNIVYYNTTQFTEKFNKQLDWNGSVVDSDNRRWNYNATRNEQSVIDAFIELMILSKTNIVSNNSSTFLKWAKRFGESNLI